jgi:hypothetical protein
MHSLIVALLVFTASFAHAATQAKDFSVTCSNSAAKIELWGEGVRFHLRLNDSAGFMGFPIYTGVVTPAVLPDIERGSKELSIFNSEVEITWDLSLCSIDSKKPFLILCGGLGKILQPEQAPFVSTNLATSVNQIESLDFQAQTLNVNLALAKTDGKSSYYFLSFPVDIQRCKLKPSRLN